MCRQLGAVARGLDVESTKSSILPELVELTKDAEKSVRIAGIEVVGDILDLFDEGLYNRRLIRCRRETTTKKSSAFQLSSFAESRAEILHWILFPFNF